MKYTLGSQVNSYILFFSQLKTNWGPVSLNIGLSSLNTSLTSLLIQKSIFCTKHRGVTQSSFKLTSGTSVYRERVYVRNIIVCI